MKNSTQAIAQNLASSFCTWLNEQREAEHKAVTKDTECVREMYKQDAERYRFGWWLLIQHLRDVLKATPHKFRLELGRAMAQRLAKPESEAGR